MLLVEIDAPDITVTVDGNDELTVQDGQQKFDIRPGPHRLHIAGGGVRFQTSDFEITRAEKVVLRITQAGEQELQVLKGESLLNAFPLADERPPASLVHD